MGEHIDFNDAQVEESGKDNASNALQEEIFQELAAGSAAAAGGAAAVGEGMRNKLEDGVDESEESLLNRFADGVDDVIKGGFILPRRRDSFEASDKDKDSANEMVEKEISKLIPKQDRQILEQMTSAIVNGDLGSLQKAIKALGPERAGKFVKEIERTLQDAGEENLDVHITTNKDGNVIVYSKGNNTAVEVSPEGKASVRPVSFDKSGNVVLEPGEVLNKDAAEVMQAIGNEAVFDLIHGGKDDFSWLRKIPDDPGIGGPFWGGPFVKPFVKPKDLGFDGQYLKLLSDQIDKRSVLNGVEMGLKAASPIGGMAFDAARGAFKSAVENLKGVSEKKK